MAQRTDSLHWLLVIRKPPFGDSKSTENLLKIVNLLHCKDRRRQQSYFLTNSGIAAGLRHLRITSIVGVPPPIWAKTISITKVNQVCLNFIDHTWIQTGSLWSPEIPGWYCSGWGSLKYDLPTRKSKMRKKMKKNWGKMRENTGKWGKLRKCSYLAHPGVRGWLRIRSFVSFECRQNISILKHCIKVVVIKRTMLIR